MGPIVPLLESEMANVIPMWMDAPSREHAVANREGETDLPSVSKHYPLYNNHCSCIIIVSLCTLHTLAELGRENFCAKVNTLIT